MSTEIDGVNGIIKNTTSDGDITIKGNDGGSEISALTLDMSDAGTATFNHDISLSTDGAVIHFGADSEVTLTHVHNTGLVINSGAGSNTLQLQSTDGGNSAGPILNLYRNSSSPADDDILGQLKHTGRNSNSEDVIYSSIITTTKTVTNGSENGLVDINVMSAGSLLEFAAFQGSVGTVFNESSNDLDFRVESNGNSHMLFVDGGNDCVNVGGLTVAGGKLNVETTDDSDSIVMVCTSTNASEGPVLKFKRDNNSSADGDLTGSIKFQAESDANSQTVYTELQASIEDDAHGSEKGRITLYNRMSGTDRNVLDITAANVIFNQDSQDLDFRVESNDNATMFHVDAGRNEVGVGSSNDYSAALLAYQAATDHNSMNVEANNGSYAATALNVGVTRNSSGQYNFIKCEARGFANKFTVRDDGLVSAVTTTIASISDERIKQDITDANSQWDDIKALKFKNFKRKTAVRNDGDDALIELGVIAQEVEAAGMTGLIDYADPDTGHIQDDATFGTLYTQADEDAGNIPSGHFVNEVKEVKEQVKMVKYSIIWMKAMKALQEAQTRIETLETKVAALEG